MPLTAQSKFSPLSAKPQSGNYSPLCNTPLAVQQIRTKQQTELLQIYLPKENSIFNSKNKKT